MSRAPKESRHMPTFTKPMSVLVENDVPTPMRDGTVLTADIYRPAAPGRYPVVLQRTPY
ncbi:MAG: hypothetical protein FJ318_06210, partial [SAR202 cluster bacterium]|nr:hypothetical protein [SAR202 cluster bacterium]